MRRLCIPGFLLLAAVVMSLPAEDSQDVSSQGEASQDALQDVLPVSNSPLQRLFPHFKGRALVLDINARVVEKDQTVIWDEFHQKATIPGRPVGIKLVGTNVVVVAQFTPYLRPRNMQKVLVAQGQIWMDVPNQGIRYHTSMQTIPLEFDEPIYFFPLGPLNDGDAACIEIMVTLHPYEAEGE